MMRKKPSLIIPYLIETNGKVERFLEVARNPKVQKEYEKLLRELEANPKNIGKKLRDATWSKKSLDEIAEEMESEKGR
jgi:hypothetical protein